MVAHGYVILITATPQRRRSRQMSWTGDWSHLWYRTANTAPLIHILLATLFPTLPWVRLSSILNHLSNDNRPLPRPPRPRFGRKGRPGHIHGLPYDGLEPRKGAYQASIHVYRQFIRRSLQWVNDVADAGGSLYCFHIEATCKSHSRWTHLTIHA